MIKGKAVAFGITKNIVVLIAPLLPAFSPGRARPQARSSALGDAAASTGPAAASAASSVALVVEPPKDTREQREDIDPPGLQ